MEQWLLIIHHWRSSIHETKTFTRFWAIMIHQRTGVLVIRQVACAATDLLFVSRRAKVWRRVGAEWQVDDMNYIEL